MQRSRAPGSYGDSALESMVACLFMPKRILAVSVEKGSMNNAINQLIRAPILLLRP